VSVDSRLSIAGGVGGSEKRRLGRGAEWIRLGFDGSFWVLENLKFFAGIRMAQFGRKQGETLAKGHLLETGKLNGTA
jgi:hypothetical protein